MGIWQPPRLYKDIYRFCYRCNTWIQLRIYTNHLKLHKRGLKENKGN